MTALAAEQWLDFGYREDRPEARSGSELFAQPISARNELKIAYLECADGNWDGDNAPAVKYLAYTEADKFLERLPLHLPMPEITADADGDIGFQWFFGKDRILTVTFNGENVASYAAIICSPRRKKFGSEYLNDDIPKEILEYLSELAEHPQTIAKD